MNKNVLVILIIVIYHSNYMCFLYGTRQLQSASDVSES